MHKIIVSGKISFEEAVKVAKAQGFNTVVMVQSADNKTTIVCC